MAPLSLASLLGGYSWLFALAFILMLAFLFAVFVYRQIGRLRRNNLRQGSGGGGGGLTMNAIGSDLPAKVRQLINGRIGTVNAFRLCRQPNFTDCSTFGAYAQSPDRFRMIALDEVGRVLDRQLEQLSPTLCRQPGELTWDFLLRVRRQVPLPSLDEPLIARLTFFHEWARFRTDQPFDEAELDELRSLLRRFIKILSQNSQIDRIPVNPASASTAASPRRRAQTSADGQQLTEGLAKVERARLEERPERRPLLLSQD
uniref:Uncharacterized protein n=1 Tax=Globodera rostochiensis TaxID=31243 RepID=A0A914IB76_GLORO